jgi:regulator of protease activity HflC (stomatin/prohibitin superfamily)
VFIYVVLAVIVLIIFLFLMAGLKIVRPYERGIVERVGKYKETKESGLQIIIPFVDTIKRVDMREQVVDVPPQEVITSDNVVVSVDAVVFYEPTDPKRLVYNIANFVLAITKLAQTNLRNLIGELQLDGALTSRDQINATLRTILDEATDKWGVRVVRVEIQRIEPPPDVMAAMHEQMKAERERRATVIEAEGFRESEITRAEGEKQSRILEAEGQRQSAILAAEGEALAVRTVAEAERYRLQTVAEGEAEATRQIFQAIHDGDPTADLLAVRYIDALAQIADGRATKIIVPTEFSGVLGAVMGIAEAMRPVVDTETDSSAAPASEDLNLE